MLSNELAGLWEESLEDADFRFELKAQDIAVKLASAVAASDISQKKLAEQLGWKESRVSKVLHGSSNLTLKTMFNICEALNIDFDIHFGGLHHLNQQVEVIKYQKHKLNQMMKQVEQLNRIAWNKAARDKQISRTVYVGNGTGQVSCL